MEIKHKEIDKKGEFYVEIDGKTLAKMTYSWTGDNSISIDHTEVGEELRGKGAGKLMVYAAVDYAHEKHVKIVPLCPFANSVFEKRHDLRHVL